VARAPGWRAPDAYRVISDFGRYAALTDAVVGVAIDDLGGGRTGATWEVRFRRGILRWSEEDRFDQERCRVDFTLIEGDVEELEGCWEVSDDGDGCRLRFVAHFDMGIPTISHIVEPLAEETLAENMVVIVRKLIGGAEILEVTPSPGADQEPVSAGAGGG
jgi:ribosome-associated toxin RatA of RatAB toxin-antitoxin module